MSQTVKRKYFYVSLVLETNLLMKEGGCALHQHKNLSVLCSTSSLAERMALTGIASTTSQHSVCYAH